MICFFNSSKIYYVYWTFFYYHNICENIVQTISKI